MARRGTYIFRLAKKIDFLAETLAEADEIDEATRPALATHAHLNLSTLKSACGSERVSGDVESKLAAAGDFCPNDPVWNDRDVSEDDKLRVTHNYPGRDTPSAFRELIRSVWGLGLGPKLRMKGFSPKSLDSNLASFSLSDLGQETPEGEAVNVFLQLDLTPGYHNSGYSYGFKKVRIRLLLDPQTAAGIQERLGHLVPAKINRASLHARGTDFEPFWELEIEDGILDGEYSTKEAPLVQLAEQRPGNELEALLTIQLFDGSLRRSDGKPSLGKAKEAIIERLIAMKIGIDPSPHGWLDLGIQKLKIVKSER